MSRKVFGTKRCADGEAGPEAAKAFIKYLTAPEAIPVIKAKGWEPVTE